MTELQEWRVKRLMSAPPTDRLASWIVTITITLLAFVLRIINLGWPHNLVFDETYYAKDAYSLLNFGYERDWPSNANTEILAGHVNVFKDTGSFIVHPPLGKWLIAIGEWLFGMNSFGWRFMACVFGSLLVLFTIRLARRISRSTLVGGIAGLLLCFDGLAFVMSRVALLDIFLATFLVAGAAALIADRDYYRNQLGRQIAEFGNVKSAVLLNRPWLWVAGLCFAAALATKWNTLYFLAAFGLLTVFWGYQTRKIATGRETALDFFTDSFWAFLWLVVLSVMLYVVSWVGWFASTNAWDRNYGVTNPNDPLVKYFGNNLGSWLYYQKQIYDFHTGSYINHATHPYAANPLGWIFMIRPTAMDAVNDIKPYSPGCPWDNVGSCIAVVNGMGTPLLWWLIIPALGYAGYRILRFRDWRYLTPMVAFLAGWLPWFHYDSRPLFFFYAITIIPFTVTIFAMALGELIGPTDGPKRRVRSMIVGLVVAFIILNFGFIYPVLTGEIMPRAAWQMRMWLPSWI